MIYTISGITKETKKLSIQAKTLINILEVAGYIKPGFRGLYKHYFYINNYTETGNNSSTEILDFLHPLIVKSSFKQYSNGLYRDAIFNAFVAVFDLIRQRTKLDDDGLPLAQRVFSPNSPKLIVSTLETESGKNEQLGFMKLLEGAYLSIRNPKAHSLLDNPDQSVAAQNLIFASLLARRVEESKEVT